MGECAYKVVQRMLRRHKTQKRAQESGKIMGMRKILCRFASCFQNGVSLFHSLEALYQNTYAVDRLSLFGRRTDEARYSEKNLILFGDSLSLICSLTQITL